MKTALKPKNPPKPRPKPKVKAGDNDRSHEDAILCIKPEFTKLIAERKKNYEYRKYKLKDSVKHLWLYETAPTSAITYVAPFTSCPLVICADSPPSLFFAVFLAVCAAIAPCGPRC